MIKRAVIIDDDKTIILTLNKFLSDLGYEVFFSEHGQRGLELVKKIKPSILFSDMLLPGLHGVEICRRIKADQELKKIYVVLMTSVYKAGVYRSENMECNADGFLEKPFDLDKVKNLIERFEQNQN
jgi:CheY-like chemotaxis protein